MTVRTSSSIAGLGVEELPCARADLEPEFARIAVELKTPPAGPE
ncbi:hypothetical protein C7S16_0660 [Burkholderia thailandensis]|uniref:Uncharacterized protein n=1 Tax=Burkholderia thailandensis TaxID=57975 RepID=A0AAW9CWT9_BURTH|nr:hypothetical protein [Burkholderia thailandensis]MDW9254131.1 hypothetical protein [Burkholderia thailandensis]